jgi:hypothetical protein
MLNSGQMPLRLTICRLRNPEVAASPVSVTLRFQRFILSTGNGSAPSCIPFQLGTVIVTPLPAQSAHLALRRRTSPEASEPQRMISGASATGMPRPHALQ